MILPKDQINRYLRHIIIPEISGVGQKKITESKIFILASTVMEASALIYYLAASGFGYISCRFKDATGYESLFRSVGDLNEHVLIELADNQIINEGITARIFISAYDSLEENLIGFSRSHDCSKFIPAIAAINCGWKGFLQTFCSQEDLNCLLSNSLSLDLNSTTEILEEKEGPILSSCLLSALAVIECIKLSLNLGTVLAEPLHFNLLSMEFLKHSNKDSKLSVTDFLKNSYCENQSPVNFQGNYNTKKLSDSKVLIVGTGGLGSPAAYALSSLGIGTIGLIDYDKVELSNLNRQILHSVSRINMPKVESAEVFIKSFNPNVKVVTHNTSINIGNALDIVKEYDVVVDALDNFPARYLLNDSCYFANKPLVDAAAVKFHGLIMSILPNSGPCYRCAFPVMANQKNAKSCAEAGVLGPVPGVMGFIQAAEVVKLLLGRGKTLSNRIIYYDALDSDFDTIDMNKSSNCDLCGTHPTITSLIEYNNSCETKKNKESS